MIRIHKGTACFNRFSQFLRETSRNLPCPYISSLKNIMFPLCFLYRKLKNLLFFVVMQTKPSIIINLCCSYFSHQNFKCSNFTQCFTLAAVALQARKTSCPNYPAHCRFWPIPLEFFIMCNNDLKAVLQDHRHAQKRLNKLQVDY